MLSSLKSSIILFIAVAALGVGVYAHALSTVSASDIDVTGVNDVSIEGFSFDAELNLTNDGFLPVRIHGITYNVTRNGTPDLLANGSVNAVTVPGRSQQTTAFTVNESWTDSTVTAVQTLADNNPAVTIDASIQILGTPRIAVTRSTTHELFAATGNDAPADDAPTNTTNGVDVPSDGVVPDLGLT